MTNKEYIQTVLAIYCVSEPTVDLILIKNEIDPVANLTDIKVLDKAICLYIPFMLANPNVSEGGYSISWNIEGIKSLYYALCGQLGIAPNIDKPIKMVNQSHRW